MTSDDLKSWGKNDLIREVRKLRALLEQQMSAAPGIGDEVTVDGIVGMASQEPIVVMRAGEAAWQFTPAQARQHALLVLDKAVEAERDAATVAFLREGDFPDETVGGFLVGMREHRQDWLEQMRSGG